MVILIVSMPSLAIRSRLLFSLSGKESICSVGMEPTYIGRLTTVARVSSPKYRYVLQKEYVQWSDTHSENGMHHKGESISMYSLFRGAALDEVR